MDTTWGTYLRIINLHFNNMSTNRLSHLKEWEKIYLEVTRDYGICDDKDSVRFKSNSDSSYLDDNDTFYTLEELKTLANDGMPKQGDMIEARYKTECGVLSNWFLVKFVCSYEWGILVDIWSKILRQYDEWRYPLKKTELTLAEVEERLWLDAWSLIIK